MRAIARLAIRVVAVLYLVGLFFDGVGYDPPIRNLPGPLRYAIEVAALFPDASKAVSEYRAEAWVCDDKRWEEIDTRPYFPLHPDDKENRFQRILHFYHDDATTKRALGEFITNAHNDKNSTAGDDYIPRNKLVGGVRLLIVRWPIPTPGDKLTEYSIVPLAHIRSDATRGVFYEPTKAELATGCSPKAASEVAQ
jgi:hypothetical protein